MARSTENLFVKAVVAQLKLLKEVVELVTESPEKIVADAKAETAEEIEKRRSLGISVNAPNNKMLLAACIARRLCAAKVIVGEGSSMPLIEPSEAERIYREAQKIHAHIIGQSANNVFDFRAWNEQPEDSRMFDRKSGGVKGYSAAITLAQAAVMFIYTGNHEDTLFEKVKELLSPQAILAKQQSLQIEVDKREIPAGPTSPAKEPEPVDPKKVELEIASQKMVPKDLIKLIAVRAASKDPDPHSKAAFGLLHEEVEYAKNNKLNNLLTVPVLMRSISYATELPNFIDQLVQVSEERKVGKLIRENGDDVVKNCPILLCAAGGVDRETTQDYIRNKVRATIMEAELGADGIITNRAYRDQLSEISEVHTALLKLGAHKPGK